MPEFFRHEALSGSLPEKRRIVRVGILCMIEAVFIVFVLLLLGTMLGNFVK